MKYWKRVRVWLHALSQPRARAVTHVSAWALRGVLWRNRLNKRIETTRSVLRRLEPALHLPFFVLPSLVGANKEPEELEKYEFTPPTQARSRIIANPASGSMHSDSALRDLSDSAKWLTEHGMPTELRLTRRAGHATDLAREAAVAGYEMVVAAGGDGTVNDVIQALAGYRTALGVLPMGTVNVWAREMGISLTTAEACQTLLDGVRRRVDLGRAGQRYFLMMAGIGLDAEAARQVEKHGRLKRFGLKIVEYFATVMRLGVTRQSDTILISTGVRKRREQALMVIIGNTRLYGGAMTFTRNAVADDGVLDVVVIGSGGILYRLNVFGRALLRTKTPGPNVRYDRAQSVRLESRRPVPVQVDGEVIGYLPMTFGIAPLALSVIVPATAPASLFNLAPEPRRLD